MKVVWDRVWNVTLWVLQGAMAVMFLVFGVTKFDPHVIFWTELFTKIGIGQWFRLFTGGLEVIGAAMIIPRTAGIAAALLACTMAGAVSIHLFMLRDGYAAFFPGLPLLMLVIVGWKRGLLPAR
ncbi:MAG TPA: DoxX family protein [Terriglobia bacterium]|nr:DoxX family protein [Terriglobia bacterium]